MNERQQIGDLNGDAHVDNLDLQSLINLVASLPPPPPPGGGSVAAVPEPSGLALAAMGFTALAACTWRRYVGHRSAGGADGNRSGWDRRRDSPAEKTKQLCTWFSLGAIVLLAAAQAALANGFIWTNSAGGDWKGPNWNFLGSPGTNDSATFSLPSATYTVSFSFPPSPVQDLNVSAGKIAFSGGAGGATLSVTSTSGGGQTVTVAGPNTSLTLGSSGGAGSSPMNLTAGKSTFIQNGATLNTLAGSQLNTGFLFVNSGTLLVDGSSGAAGGQASAAIASGVGMPNAFGIAGGAAAITFSNGATGDFRVGGIDLANDSTAGTSGTLNVLSGAMLSVGNLNLATSGGATTSATLDIEGASSSLIQSGATLNVGHSATGAAVINIGTTSAGASLSTGTGLFTINKTGTVNLGIPGGSGSTLNVHGDITIDGGALQNNGKASEFVWDASHTMTVINGGRATFLSGFNTASSAEVTISGNGSKLETTAGQAPIVIQNLGLVSVNSGGLLSSAGVINLGNSSTDTTELDVDGLGSAVVSNATSQSTWDGLKSSVSFTNGASGTFPSGIDLAMSGDGASVSVAVKSGASLHVGNLNVAAGSHVSVAVVTISDASTSVMLNPNANLVIGDASGGTATINVNSGATLALGAGGATALNSTGALNINGGTVDLKSLTASGGVVNLVAGSLSFIGNLTAGTGGLLGANPNIGFNQSITLTGTTTIDASHTLTLSGGTLNTGSLTVNGAFAFNAGTLGITQPNALINTSIVSNSPSSTININANNVALGNASSFTGFLHQGTLNVGGNSVTLNSAGYADLGVLTTLNGGTITAPNGVSFGSGSNFSGHGTINAQVTGELGSVIDADGSLALGDSTSPAGFNFAGQLRTHANSVTLNSSAPATLGNLTLLGTAASPGTLNAANGLVVNFGAAVTGFGTINSSNTLALHSVINGTVQGTSAAQPLTLTGWIKGVGSFNNVVFSGTYDPGFSPTLATVGSVSFGPANVLNVELGGTARGSQYDAVIASGNLTLGGSLQVSLINNFSPGLGNSFDILDWAARSGTFSSMQLPALSGSLVWNTSQLYNTGVISVIDSNFLPGDMNRGGHVDVADISAMESALIDLDSYKATHLFGGLPMTDLQLAEIGDFTGDSKVTNADLQGLINLLANGGGSGGALVSAVPEPSGVALAALATFAAIAVRLRQRFV
jgi:hypothetical protein